MKKRMTFLVTVVLGLVCAHQVNAADCCTAGDARIRSVDGPDIDVTYGLTVVRVWNRTRFIADVSISGAEKMEFQLNTFDSVNVVLKNIKNCKFSALVHNNNGDLRQDVLMNLRGGNVTVSFMDQGAEYTPGMIPVSVHNNRTSVTDIRYNTDGAYTKISNSLACTLEPGSCCTIWVDPKVTYFVQSWPRETFPVIKQQQVSADTHSVTFSD